MGPSKTNDQEAPCRTSKKNFKKIWLCMDGINNTGLQWEANMAAENTNSRPDEEDYDRDISTSIENDIIMMNDITAQEGREDRDFTTNIENESITSDTTTEKTERTAYRSRY